MKQRIAGLFFSAFLLGMLSTDTAAAPVSLTRVFPDKLRYVPGEKGIVQVTLRNTTDKDQAVTLASEIVQELAQITPGSGRDVTVPRGEEITVDLPLTAPQREYGCAVRVRVMQGGQVVTQTQNMFSVADSVWKVAIGADLPMMSASGYGWQEPANDIKIAREQYFNWWEKCFWAPDDFGNMTPTETQWYSGEGRLEIKKLIKELTALAKANGIASITYGKSTAGGPSGWDLCRSHPDWFTQDSIGRPNGIYDTAYFPLEKWNHWGGTGINQWFYLYPNLNRPDTLDWGIGQLIASALEYGWDGVRFDGDFTWVGSDEVATRNQRQMKERVWARLPHFVFGYNEGYGPADSDPATWPHSLREGLAGGGHWMNEGIRQYGRSTNARYTSYRDYWTDINSAADRLRRIGASYHCIYDAAPHSVQGMYKVVLGTAAGAHPVYGDTAKVPGCTNWGRFLTRWSAFVWDASLRDRPDTDATVTAAVPLWLGVKERVVNEKTKDTIVQLIVPPTTDTVDATNASVGASAQQVRVRVRVPTGETVIRAAIIAPEHPDEAHDLPVTREGEWTVITVPDVALWSIVVVERAGRYELSAYPRFTEAPDVVKVKEGIKQGIAKLVRDPLKPEEQSGEASRVRALETESLYQTQGQVESDPDASGGKTTRIDHTMGNSTVITHALFNNVTPGRYRASFRMKLKSKTDDAGKAIWAGFGLFVYLGEKQVWLKEIGPDDFKTPGQYEDFSVEFDFLGEGTKINPAAFWRGQQAGGAVYVDKVTLEQLSTFRDADLEQKLHYIPHKDVKPGAWPGLDVLALNGLYSDLYRLPEALQLIGSVSNVTPQKMKAPTSPDELQLGEAGDEGIPPAADVRVTVATVRVDENAALLTQFPKPFEELCNYDVVVLINADASWLQFPGRAMLRDFVNAGGGLVILGGNFTLGQGYFADTFLADLLPVTVAKARDLQQADHALPLKPAKTGLAQRLPAGLWTPAACLYWRHRVAAKPEAQVHLFAGDEPVLFTGTFGKGRVAVFTGTVLGEPAAKEQPFWQWEGWPLLMRSTIEWVAAAEGTNGDTKRK